MLLDQQTLIEALPDFSNIMQPAVIHLVAYERSASAPALSQTSSSSSSSRTPPTSRSRTQRQVNGGRQRNLSPVHEAADGGEEVERGGVALPVNNNDRMQQPQGSVSDYTFIQYTIPVCVVVLY